MQLVIRFNQKFLINPCTPTLTLVALPRLEGGVDVVVVVLEHGDWRQLYKNGPSRKIYSQRLLSREYDFRRTFSLTENLFSGKTYSYTIGPCARHAHAAVLQLVLVEVGAEQLLVGVHPDRDELVD